MIYIMAFFACMLASCSEELEVYGSGEEVNGRSFTLQLRASGDTTEAGEDAYNENRIAAVSVFFFTDKETATCSYMKRNIPTNNSNMLSVPLDDTFKPGEYFIFVLANVPVHQEPVTGKFTLNQMKKKLMYTQLSSADKPEDAFVMQGLTEKVMVASGAQGGTVTLSRLAAKIVLLPTIKSPIKIDGVTYTAEVDRMDVALHHVTNYVHPDGTELTRKEYNDRLTPEEKEKTFTTTDPRKYKSVTAPGAAAAYVHIPFYSYPHTWLAYTETSQLVQSEKQTYLTFRIPWTCTKNGVQLSTNYYYRVPVTNEIISGSDGKEYRSLKSNTLYKIKMNVGVLGSIDPGQVTPDVDLKYEISDWKSVGISADVNKYNYLELETNYVEMNNESRADIGLTSSSDVTAKVVKITYPDYSGTTIKPAVTMTEPVKPNREDFTGLLDEYRYQQALKRYESDLKTWNNQSNFVTVYGQSITFEHAVSADVYVPYTYTIEVTNKDGQKQELTITQYPPIYITGEYNSNGSSNRFVYGETTNETWVGGWDAFYTVVDDNNKSLGGAHDPGDGSSSNNNKNQYTIHVTQLDAADESKYIIGDPRDPTPTKLSNLTKYGTSSQKGLQSYLKTRGETGTEREYDRMIAPVFKIASSWGVVTKGSIDYAQAQKRCASYQENGYPAGRWRIPTEGEIEFIVSLSNKGYIPKLFGGDYYASSKRYYIGGDEGTEGKFGGTAGSNNGNRSVRCVYDVWYWGDEKLANPNVFTWGDTEPIRPNN